MSPSGERRLPAVLGVSLLLWLPALRPFVAGNLDAAAAAARYAGALALAWLAVTGLVRLVGGYASPARSASDALHSASGAPDDDRLPRAGVAEAGS